MSRIDLREPPQRASRAADSSVRRSARKPALSRGAIFGLLLLLVAPAAALYRFSAFFDYRILFGGWIAICGITYILYLGDKRKAQREEWRTPEVHLHISEFLGGWPAAFLAQRLIRHKSSKASYQWKFWSIVALHQFVAIDYLLRWSVTRGAAGMLRSLL